MAENPHFSSDADHLDWLDTPDDVLARQKLSSTIYTLQEGVLVDYKDGFGRQSASFTPSNVETPIQVANSA